MSLEDRAAVYSALGDPQRLRIVDLLALNDMTSGEISRATGLRTNLLAHHLKILDEARIIQRRTSAGDRRRRYVGLRPGFVEGLLPNRHIRASSVLFVCTHNSVRSQFAEAVFRQRSSLQVQSAGTEPAESVHPKAIRVGLENGLDLSAHHPKTYEAVEESPDLVVSVCDRARETGIPAGGYHVHWSIPDPAESGRIDDFRAVLREIRGRVNELVKLVDPETTQR